MRALVVGAALVAAAGCSEKRRADRVLESKTFVIEKGEEPRYMLRYQIPAGTTQAFTIWADASLELSGDGIAAVPEVTFPRVKMDQEVEVDAVDDRTGAMHVIVTLADVDHQARPDAAAIDKTLMEGFYEMEGMRMSGTLFPSGQMRGVLIDPTSIPADMKDTLTETEQIVDQVVAVMPDVPVGKGARWRLERVMMQGPLKVRMETSYELLEVSETTAVVTAVSEISAADAVIKTGGVKATVDDLTGHCDITTDVDFAQLITRAHGSFDLDITLSAGGQSVEMVEKMALQVLPDGEAPEPPAPGRPVPVEPDGPPPGYEREVLH